MFLLKHFSKIIPVLGLGFLVFTSLGVHSASFDFSPVSKELLSGCKSSINIDANAGGQQSNAADIEVAYNPNEISILDSNSDIPGVQIKNGNAYESYFGNQVDVNSGKILLAGASFVGNLSSRRTFATIEFTSKPSVTSTSFKIKFDGAGATLDSNIADASTSDDLLTSVTNGSYTFTTGPCQADRIPPVIDFQYPKNYDSGVPLDSDVRIRITDNQSGVNLDSLIFVLNDDTYTVKSPEVAYTGVPLDYSFVIKPKNKFNDAKESYIKVNASDLAGNKSNGQIVFNIPPAVIKEVICPALETNDDIDGDGVPNIIDTDPYNPEKGGNNLNLFKGTIIEKAASQPIFQGAREARESTSSLKTLQYYTLLAILILLLTILGLFLGRNIREVHGSAINLATNEPYQNLQVELKELVSGKSISETTTDYSGEYIFKTKPGAYIATLSREGDNWSQTIIVPEITKIGVYNPGQKILVNNEDKYLSQASWIFNLVRRFLAQITPGFWLAGSVLSLLNMVILTTILNIVIFSFYITVGIMAFLFNKLRN